MGNFDAAEVIKAAATSNLGVISLIVLVLAFLAWRLFQRSDDKVKLIAFAMMFVGAAGFVGAVMATGGDAGEDPADPQPSGTIDPDRAPPAGEAESGEAAGATNLTGLWYDADGYSFAIQHDGGMFSFKAFFGGAQAGWGSGSVTGTRLNYHFVDQRNGGEGNCEADVIDADTIRGSCIEGNVSWNLTIRRR